MIRIFALTDAGAALGRRLQSLLETAEQPVQFHLRPDHFAESVQTAFEHSERLIFVGAIGVAVRTLAPVLKDKYQDPAVLVVDEQGEFVIPLLSAHEGGANTWGQQVSEALNATLVVTSSKPYLQPVYTVGIACERGCEPAHLQAILQQCLTDEGLTMADIVSINSIDSKANEAGLMQLAKEHTKLFQTFSAEALASVDQDHDQPLGIADLAALWAAQQATQSTAELIAARQTNNPKATCAIARSYPPGSGSTGLLD